MGGEMQGSRRSLGGPWVMVVVIAVVLIGTPFASDLYERFGLLLTLLVAAFVGLAAGCLGAALQRRADRSGRSESWSLTRRSPPLHLLRALMVGVIVGLCVTLLGPRIGYVQAFGIALLAVLLVSAVIAHVERWSIRRKRRKTARSG